MGRVAQEAPSLGERLADERQVHLLQVAQAAMDEPRRARRRPDGDVVLLDERRSQARATSRPAARPTPTIAAADDQDVPRRVDEPGEVGRASSRAGSTRLAASRRARSSIVVVGRPSAIARPREIRHRSQAVPTMRTPIRTGPWKIARWIASGRKPVSERSAEHDDDDARRDERDLRPARLGPWCDRLNHGRPRSGCRSAPRGSAPRTPLRAG